MSLSIYVYICIYMYIRMCVCVCVCIYICIFVSEYTSHKWGLRGGPLSVYIHMSYTSSLRPDTLVA